MNLESFAKHLEAVLVKEDRDQVVLLTEGLVFENRGAYRSKELTPSVRGSLIEWMTLQSGNSPWAFELELDVVEVNVKGKRKPLIPVTSLVNSFLLSYIAHRGKNPRKTCKLAGSLNSRLPVMASLLGGYVSDVNRLLEMGGSRFRLRKLYI
ncbi:MAG TPA: hypothetical protein PKA63_04290 [Oligoflexia bacterium]|nr:hypothetical protein [Oligoflexia bacterium]HMP47869.1 hypothetical protein [Oligoflexia bacterium]